MLKLETILANVYGVSTLFALYLCNTNILSYNMGRQQSVVITRDVSESTHNF